MRGPDHVRIRHIAAIALGSAMAVASAPSAAVVAGEDVATLPRCAGLETSSAVDQEVVSPWETELDGDGAVTGHRLTLRGDGREQRLHTGRRGFMVRVGADRLLIGERLDAGTRLDMIDTAEACRLWTRQSDRLLYPARDRAAGTISLTAHDRDSRGYEGTYVLDAATGETQVVVQATCVENCLPNDGGVGVAALQPAGAPRPTPNFAGGAWPKGKALTYHWKSDAVPPAWAWSPLQSGADDATRTSISSSPRFIYRSDGANSVAYTGSLPSFCSSAAIACARRSMPSYWGVWIRPHGTDLPWGTLRWCQKTSSASGCLDIRRVILHELGHIAGLDHPSSAGFTLSVNDSVMQGITPMRPQAGASRHAYGRCDVATLQELYDTPDNKTAISTCNDVATRVTLAASSSSVRRGSTVKLTATLNVTGNSAFRQLAGNPLNGRTVALKYRRAGSADAWSTVWMRSLYSGGRYEVAITPGATWEFKAVFPHPPSEGLRFSSSDKVRVKVTRR